MATGMSDISGILQTSAVLAVIAGATLASFGLSYFLYPLFLRYALARPNARSSHKAPTPQGGGIAVIAAVLLTAALATIAAPELSGETVGAVMIAAVLLAVLGAIDDIRPLSATLRLAVQSGVVLVVLFALPADIHLLSALPIWLERTLLFFGLLWFINLVNFMDGIDWMTVAEVVPITAAMAAFSMMGALPPAAAVLALALCAAMIGFAPFNRPTARLFLGDVGSLPIGLLLGWLLILLADQHLVAAILLPLYYLSDATVTLLQRLLSGENLTQAHRRHFYQRALDGGDSNYKIVGLVFATNVILTVLAAFAISKADVGPQLLAFILGCTVVGALLWYFGRKRKIPA